MTEVVDNAKKKEQYLNNATSVIKEHCEMQQPLRKDAIMLT